jgi:antitoxin CptB
MDSDPRHEIRLRRLKFRAWHRGTRESDYTMGCFCDRYSSDWGEAEIAWFEALLDEDDADVLGWALGTIPVPERFQGALMDALRKLDFVQIPR